MTKYRISKDTGLSQNSIANFIRGEAGITLGWFDELCKYANLELKEK